MFSLLVFCLCLLMINGKYYQPDRQNNPGADKSSTKCRAACVKPCPKYCSAQVCKDQGPDFARTPKCICICPVPFTQ